MMTLRNPFRRGPSNVQRELAAVVVFAAAGLLLTAVVAAAGQIEILPF